MTVERRDEFEPETSRLLKSPPACMGQTAQPKTASITIVD